MGCSNCLRKKRISGKITPSIPDQRIYVSNRLTSSIKDKGFRISECLQCEFLKKGSVLRCLKHDIRLSQIPVNYKCKFQGDYNV